MKITKSKIQWLPCTVLIVLGVFVWVLSWEGVATALDIDFDFHDDSAHGNTSVGVNRSDAAYLTGDCSHCHDSFDESICGVKPLMLFEVDNPDSQTDNFCFQCHKGNDGTVQQVFNEDYGATFGGGTPMFSSVYEAFKPTGTYASAHNLATVKGWVRNRGQWEPDTWITDDSNACLMCHDPHFSQKNFPVGVSGYGGVKTAIRRADTVRNLGGGDDTDMLWGDESVAAGNAKEIISERWQDNVDYQAPLRGDSGYEPGPAGSSVTDGSNLVDFVWFCAYQCHRRNSVPGVERVNWYHVDEGSGGTWEGDPSAHGRLAANGGAFGVLKAPYSEASRGDYMLSCTDCHEPHGSTNPTLLRITVNGVSGLSTGAEGSSSAGGYWLDFCEACHEIYDPEDPGSSNHPVIYPGARCGQYVGCHMSTGVGGTGGNHGYQF